MAPLSQELDVVRGHTSVEGIPIRPRVQSRSSQENDTHGVTSVKVLAQPDACKTLCLV